GDGWINDMERLRDLEQFVDDGEFRHEWRAVKRHAKANLAAFVRQSTGVAVNPDAMMDTMVKRLHEYKRQMLKIMHIITLYNRVLDNPNLDIVP
ncbi:glycogen/starch/alpha-glucan phosphorylase, partial [Escherichia coli]|uniref:glycogen/starch/alpha-glucan phosphorylase n=1 Tax=Escherichia coli TaxID=562 RepID=UPI00200F061A